jgi:hypothetical protein
MQKIPIHLAEPGMILAKAIINEKGMPLCVEETVLTDSIIERLKKMQIAYVILKGTPVNSGEGQVLNAECVQELNARFLKVTGDPLMDKLRAAVEKALLAGNEEGAGNGSRKGPRHE